MLEFRPFRGWRYNLARVGNLASVISPPYDVVDQQALESLLAASPYNIIRLELPTALEADAQTAYLRAGDLLRRWCKDGILVKESEPAYYFLRQQFSLGEERLARCGLFGILRLVPFSQGVYPHEDTLAGPKADRLALLEQVHANISPIFGVYTDEAASIIRDLERIVQTRPPLAAQGPDGVLNELWPVCDQNLVRQIQADVANRSVLLADGHHRYETALAYRDLLRDRLGQDWSPEHPANFILICLVPTGDPGLRILPTHRLLRLARPLTMHEVATRLNPLFEVDLVGSGEVAAHQCWRRINSCGRGDSLALGTAVDDQWALVRPRDEGLLRRTRPERSEAWCRLGVNWLHEILLPHLLRDISLQHIHYDHDFVAAARRLRRGEAELAALVPPPGIHDFVTVSLAGERLPAKSTYFYPKIPTGFVLYRHDA